MSQNFINAVRQVQDNSTYTDNGAYALKSTGSRLLDFYATAGALRERSSEDIVTQFRLAFEENPLYAMKALFYARNIRGGLGERAVPLTIYRYLADAHPDVLRKNLPLLPFYGRWKDVLSLEHTALEGDMFELIASQLQLDKGAMDKGESVSLLAKWLPRAKVSRFGRRLARRLGLSYRGYDKMLSALCRYMDVVEVKMSQGRWSEINYEHVPSRAMLRYRKAFGNRDSERFKSYLEAVASGEKKINAGTLYPYDLLRNAGLSIVREHASWYVPMNLVVPHWDETIEAQWRSLPNYVDGEFNVLVIADTSGSMLTFDGLPLYTSIGLALYFAERNKGVFHNTFMTFSREPRLVTIQGETLKDKLSDFPVIVDNTDIFRAFELLLQTALQHNLTQEDLPKAVVIITDGQFDAQTSGGNYRTFHSVVSEEFRKHGFELPNIVYWNVNSRHNTFQTHSMIPGVQMASGHSPSVFKSVLDAIGMTPYEAMMKTLNDPIYDAVQV